MNFSYEINGVSLNMSDMSAIDEYYKAACTAEYLINEKGIAEDNAMRLARKVREIMDKYGITEDEAIDEIM